MAKLAPILDWRAARSTHHVQTREVVHETPPEIAAQIAALREVVAHTVGRLEHLEKVLVHVERIDAALLRLAEEAAKE